MIRLAGALWTRLWFAPESRFNLAMARILVAVHALWIVLSTDYPAIARLETFRVGVPSSRQWRYLLFPGNGELELVVYVLTVLALISVAAGLVPRVACVVAALGVYHLAPLETLMLSGAPYARGLTLSPIALLVLAASPCGEALTIRRRHSATGTDAPSWHYGWPLRVIQLLVVEVYVFSAYGKLATAGLDWSAAENIQRLFVIFNVDPGQGRFHALGLWIAGHRLLCLAIGVGTVVFEWLTILAPFNRHARRVFIPLALAFHVSTMTALNIHVGETWLVLVFLDWQRLGHGWRKRIVRVSRTPRPAPDVP